MSYWYICSPYTRYPMGREAAFRMACRVTAALIRCGVPVLSPICHSHPIAEHGDIDPTDVELWLRADAPLMASARGLIVVKAPGWRQSVGIAAEIADFTQAGKPIVFMSVREPLVIPREVLP
ncbi:conserved protein of unknown function (plasmid) [Rhodovastum atsumiense]|uniref:DUF1937 family protein n=1 Tax=Rhodovastum atsumiense TaxID=504468 RepID=UPI00139F2CFA|nr:DUF1937 family protein [Rhodovastum atsumiense]CAH2606502.1 conserved protein of unknown function [Rhodovastum atsumiense]